MNLAIKTLEEIGQNTSIKQHDNLIEMLDSINVKEKSLNEIGLMNKELVCGLLPADDEGGEEE